MSRSRLAKSRRAGRWTAPVAAVATLLAAGALLSVPADPGAPAARSSAPETAWLKRQLGASLIDGALESFERDELLEARGKLRVALESSDSGRGRALWWVLSHEPLRFCRELWAPVFDVAFAPDGAAVYAAASARSTWVLDVTTGAAEPLAAPGQERDLALALSPDGGRLARAGEDGVIRLWDWDRFEPREPAAALNQSEGLSRDVVSLDFSPDGQRLAAAGAEPAVQLWDLTRRAVQLLPGHFGPLQGVAFSPDGELLASAGDDEVIRLWQARSGQPQSELVSHHGPVLAVAFSPDGRWLASAGADRTVRLWDPRSGGLERTLEGHLDSVHDVAFSPDGAWLASGSSDGTVRLWSLGPDGPGRRVLRGHKAAVHSVSFSPDGRLLASGGGDQKVCLWRLGTPALDEGTGSHRAAVADVSFSPDGRRLASAGADRTVRLWRVPDGAVEHTLLGHGEPLAAVDFSPDGRLLASAGADRVARLWDLSGPPRLRRVLSGHRGEIYDVAFNSDGSLLATAGQDHSARVWDLRRGRGSRILGDHDAQVWSVAFQPRGKWLATGSGDNLIRLWRPWAAMLDSTLKGHVAAVYGLSFSPDGELLATAGADQRLRLWELQAGINHDLAKLGGPAYQVDFDPGGTRLAVATAGGLCQLFTLDLASEHQPVSGREQLAGHRGAVNAIRFSPDGHKLATAGDDGTVRLWDAGSQRPLWRAPLLLSDPPRLLSQRGFQLLEPPRGPAAPPFSPAIWRAVTTQARYAVLRDDRTLCLQTFDDQLQLWDPVADRLVAEQAVPALEQVVAAAAGCAGRAPSGVWLLPPSGAARRIDVPGRPTALGTFISEGGTEQLLIIATDEQLLQLSATGERAGRSRLDAVVSAVARIGDGLILGYENGGLEQLPADSQRPGPATSAFADVPPSPPTVIAAGPAGELVIVGFASGEIGLWERQGGGRLLLSGGLHGPVAHLSVSGDRLIAASELGDALIWDLSDLQRDRCSLLQKLWAEVDVVWEDGRLAARAPPADHPCHSP